MARRKRARSSDSSASGMAGSVLGGSRRGARRKTTGMEMSSSRESRNGEAYGDVISGQRLLPRLRALGSGFAEYAQAAANAAEDLGCVVW
uniref:Uncharacterized protein n=1 Tax=Zea mays TaxID=4577 RepID=C4J510_MAIZE|nr:unknown [Zea mays]